MTTNIPTGADYQSRLNAQTEQAQKAQDESAQQAETTPPVEEKPLTREEVQGVINSLVDSIKSLALAQDGKFISKENIDIVFGNLLRDMANREYVTRTEAIKIAKDAVPLSLQGLDSDPIRKQGDTLKLVPGNPDLAGGHPISDQAVWGQGAAGAGFDWSKVFFGPTISGTTVTIRYGEVNRDGVAQTDLTVADGDFIYIHANSAPPAPPS